MDYKFDERGIPPKIREALDELAASIPEGGGSPAEVPKASKVNAVTAADASTAISAAYPQAEVQAIATLVNANKAAINALINALTTAGLMEA